MQQRPNHLPRVEEAQRHIDAALAALAEVDGWRPLLCALTRKEAPPARCTRRSRGIVVSTVE